MCRNRDRSVYGNLDNQSKLPEACSDRSPPSAAARPGDKPTPVQVASRYPSATLAGGRDALVVCSGEVLPIPARHRPD